MYKLSVNKEYYNNNMGIMLVLGKGTIKLLQKTE